MSGFFLGRRPVVLVLLAELLAAGFRVVLAAGLAAAGLVAGRLPGVTFGFAAGFLDVAADGFGADAWLVSSAVAATEGLLAAAVAAGFACDTAASAGAGSLGQVENGNGRSSVANVMKRMIC